MSVSFYVMCKHLSLCIVFLKKCAKLSEILVVLIAVKVQQCGVVRPINTWDDGWV